MTDYRVQYVSPVSLSPLVRDDSNENLVAIATGETFPIIRDIPRFVSPNNYASSFGLQWNTFRKTQLDSFTGTSISRERLTRLAGGSLKIFRGKVVLEAGCGAGRFTEIMLGAGANVCAVDLSTAVDANYENCHRFPAYSVCQADIYTLPLVKNLFDIVVCIGVIQHTPDPEKTIQLVCSYVKPGGLLIIDHYSHTYPVTFFRKQIRQFLLTKSETFSLHFIRFLTNMLWPIHFALYKAKKVKAIRKFRSKFLQWSPLVDYQDAYSSLGTKLLYQWAMLDTYDTLTDRYKHLRSADEIRDTLISCGMTDIQVAEAGNGIEARASKPKG